MAQIGTIKLEVGWQNDIHVPVHDPADVSNDFLRCHVDGQVGAIPILPLSQNPRYGWARLDHNNTTHALHDNSSGFRLVNDFEDTIAADMEFWGIFGGSQESNNAISGSFSLSFGAVEDVVRNPPLSSPIPTIEMDLLWPESSSPSSGLLDITFTDASSNFIGQIQFEEDETVDTTPTDAAATWSPNTVHTIRFELDTINNQVRYFLDGTQIASESSNATHISLINYSCSLSPGGNTLVEALMDNVQEQ